MTHYILKDYFENIGLFSVECPISCDLPKEGSIVAITGKDEVFHVRVSESGRLMTLMAIQSSLREIAIWGRITGRFPVDSPWFKV